MCEGMKERVEGCMFVICYPYAAVEFLERTRETKEMMQMRERGDACLFSNFSQQL